MLSERIVAWIGDDVDLVGVVEAVDAPVHCARAAQVCHVHRPLVRHLLTERLIGHVGRRVKQVDVGTVDGRGQTIVGDGRRGDGRRARA